MFINLKKLLFGLFEKQGEVVPAPAKEGVNSNTYKIFCCGKTGEDSEAGTLVTMLPLAPGHIHTINGREWRCEWVDKNMSGQPLANFRPAT